MKLEWLGAGGPVGTGGAPFLYSNGQITSLAMPPEFTSGYRHAVINNAGEVAGTGVVQDGTDRAYIYTGGTIKALGTLPGESSSYAHGINNRGVVVGNSGVRAVRYSDGQVIELGWLPGDSYSVAFSINDAGQIVGRSGSTAFLYVDGTLIDLSSLPEVGAAGWTSLYEARGINNRGQIVGQGLINGRNEAFLMTPVPLPPSAILLIAGLTFLGVLGKRRTMRT